MNGVRVMTVIVSAKRCEFGVRFFVTELVKIVKRTFFSYLFVIDVVWGSYFASVVAPVVYTALNM